MRTLLLILAMVFASSGAVSTAQESDIGFSPDWIERPNGRDFERNYPRSAMNRGYSATVVLCCTPREDGAIDCQSRFEAPANMGFGAAAEVISQKFRMSQDSYAAYLATPNAWLQVPITFVLGNRTPAFEEALTSIREQTRQLCRPAAPTQETPG